MAAKTNEKSNGVVVKADDASVLPHLESWERMMKLPVVEAAWSQSQGVYGKVRGEFRKFSSLVMLDWQQFTFVDNVIVMMQFE
jgi:hypothetical protein